MKDFLLSMIQEYKTLNMTSPFRQEQVFDPKTQKTSLKVQGIFEYFMSLELQRLDALQKQPDSSAEIENLLSSDEYLNYFGRAKRAAKYFVLERKLQLARQIYITVKAFLKSAIARGQIDKNTQKLISDLNYLKPRDPIVWADRAVVWAEQVLAMLELISLRSAGQYIPLVEDKEPVALQKTQQNTAKEQENLEVEDGAL